MFDWYRFTFSDGYCVIFRDIGIKAIRAEEVIHGELLSKEFYGWF